MCKGVTEVTPGLERSHWGQLDVMSGSDVGQSGQIGSTHRGNVVKCVRGDGGNSRVREVN